MQIVINQADFKKLSSGTQAELIEQLSGRKPPGGGTAKRRTDLHWRRPVDLSPGLTVKLLHGLAEVHRKRLELFAKTDPRVSMKALLAVNGDTDVRVLSHFQGVVTRRLRRLIEDPERKAELIKWDFDSTKWSRDGTTIVDGTYYVSKRTAASLMEALKPAHGKGA